MNQPKYTTCRSRLAYRQIVLLFLLLSSGLIGCGKNFGGSRFAALTKQTPPIQCKPEKSQNENSDSQSATSNKISSIGITSFLSGKWALQLASKAEMEIQEGFEFVAVVDQNCASNHETPLTSNLDRNRFSLGAKASVEKTFAVRLPKNIYASDLQKMIDADHCILGISNKRILHPNTLPNDPRWADQKFHKTINTSVGWDSFFHPTTGIQKDVTIAIIDSGIDLKHEDLKDVLWSNSGEIPANGIDDDKNGYVDDVNGYNFADNLSSPQHSGNWQGYYHGTHVAGLAAAKAGNGIGVAGVMGYHAKVMALNVFGSEAGAATENIDAAIRYAADNGANIINMSLGGPGAAETTKTALDYASSKGVVIIVAAGNDNVSLAKELFTPAGYAKDVPGMLAVGSVDSDTKKRSSFSNFDKTFVEISAPGSNGILSTMPNNQYKTEQGTSMASPVVAGAAALTYGFVWARSKKVPLPDLVKKLMMTNSFKSPDLATAFKDGNLLDLKALAAALEKAYPITSVVGPVCPN